MPTMLEGVGPQFPTAPLHGPGFLTRKRHLAKERNQLQVLGLGWEDGGVREGGTGLRSLGCLGLPERGPGESRDRSCSRKAEARKQFVKCLVGFTQGGDRTGI